MLFNLDNLAQSLFRRELFIHQEPKEFSQLGSESRELEDAFLVENLVFYLLILDLIGDEVNTIVVWTKCVRIAGKCDVAAAEQLVSEALHNLDEEIVEDGC